MKNKQQKRKIKKTIISIYTTIGALLVFAAIIFAAGGEETVKTFDGSLTDTIKTLIVCLIMGAVGAYMLKDSSKYADI